MKILHVSPITPSKGGYSRGHIDLSILLDKFGIESAFVIPETDDIEDYMGEIGIQFYGIATSSLPGIGTISFERGLRKKLKGIIEDFRPDIIISETVGLGPTVSSIGQKSNQIRLLHWEKSPPTENSVLGKLQMFHWYRTWKKFGMKADAAMFQSKPHMEYARKITGVAPEESIIMENGVDVDLFQSKEEIEKVPNKICYIGTVSKVRGIPDIIAAGEILHREGVNFEINIFGNGNLKENCKRLAKTRDWLVVHDFLEEDDLVRHLSESAIGIVPHPDLPAWRICSALKLREYAAMGMMVVARGLPVHTEFSEQRWMVIREDGVGKSSLAEGIKAALSVSLETRVDVSNEARDYAERYFTYEYQTRVLIEWITREPMHMGQNQ